VLSQSREARLARARELGFDPDKVYYHGTAVEFDQFSKKKLGTLTQADSAKEGFFFSASPRTSSQYANMAQSAKEHVGDTVDGEIEETIAYYKSIVDDPNATDNQKMSAQKTLDQIENESSAGPNVMPVHLRFSNPKIVEMNFTKYSDTNRPRLGEEIRKAKSEGYDAVIFRNFSDTLGPVLSNEEKEELYLKALESQTETLEKLRDKLFPQSLGDPLNMGTITELTRVLELGREEGKSPVLASKKLWNYLIDISGSEEAADEVVNKLVLTKIDVHSANRDFTDQIVVFEPNQIRSVNAEFNPKYRESGRLMKNEGGIVRVNSKHRVVNTLRNMVMR
jgi:hypothetical protein